MMNSIDNYMNNHYEPVYNNKTENKMILKNIIQRNLNDNLKKVKYVRMIYVRCQKCKKGMYMKNKTNKFCCLNC